jgi:leucyl/phenylalanyl-tRNA--protein transferase
MGMVVDAPSDIAAAACHLHAMLMMLGGSQVSSLGSMSHGAALGPIGAGGTPLPRQGIASHRDQLFRETWFETCERVVLGIAWALYPKRIAELMPFARIWVKHVFEPELELPDIASIPDAGEIVGIANDLSVPTLLQAYARGLFPHSHVGTPNWLSPPERCVLFFDNFHMSKRLKRLMRQGRYTVTFDRDFEGVIKACAGKREGRFHLTWITPRIMYAYARLFDAGYAHSFEVWNAEGKLVGGGYGVALGRIFFTESQFSVEPNTSKLGFSVLNWHLARWGYVLNDGKWDTSTILDMGFGSIPRRDFLQFLAADAGQGGKQGRWSVEAGPDVVAGWREAQTPGGDGKAMIAA